MNILTQEEINRKLEDLPLWLSDGKSISREISAANFAAAVGIVNSIAVIAETLDHHPDILLYGWNKIRITVSTHDKGGLTEKDFSLAEKIEQLGI